MKGYYADFQLIEKTLDGFADTGKIDALKLDIFDSVIKRSNTDQIRILNNTFLNLNDQRILFGVFRNISETSRIMKSRLEQAYSISENPTTVEVALEIMPLFYNLSGFIDDFFNKMEIFDSEKIFIFSRNLYKKAKKLGFSQDTSSQLKEIGLSATHIKKFVDKFNENIISELELEEEVGPADEHPN